MSKKFYNPPKNKRAKILVTVEKDEMDHLKGAREFVEENVSGAHLDIKLHKELNVVEIDTRPHTNFRKMIDEVDKSLKPKNRMQIPSEVNKRKYRPLNVKKSLKGKKKSTYKHDEFSNSVDFFNKIESLASPVSPNLISPTNDYSVKLKKNENNKMFKKALELERHEENMLQMNGIIVASENAEKNYLQKYGEKGKFSSVLAYNRRVNRNRNEQETNKLLSDIKNRNRQIDLNVFSKKKGNRKNEFFKLYNKKNKWIEQTKKRSYKNYLSHLQQARIEEINEKTRTKHEKQLLDLKHKLHEAVNERNHVSLKNKVLKEKGIEKEEEIKSLKYTIEIMTAKMNKMSEKKILNERKLKTFEQYEPLFEHLSLNFNFSSPKEVIDRMTRLEKNSKDSYTQLLDVQQRKNEVQRELDRLKQQFEIKVRQRICELNVAFQREQKKNDELKQMIDGLKTKLEVYQKYKQTYLNLHDVVNNLWSKLKARVKKETGNEISAEPDPCSMEELVDAIDNWVMTFSKNTDEKHFHECPSTKKFQQFSKLACQLWLKYLKDRPEMKNNPLKVFAVIGEKLRKEIHKSKLLKLQVDHLKKQTINVQKNNLSRSTDMIKKRPRTSVSRKKRSRSFTSTEKVKTRPHTSTVRARRNMINQTTPDTIKMSVRYNKKLRE